MKTLLGLALVWLAGFAVSRAAESRPNILWLIAEDACPDFGCYGVAEVRTPNIDRFADESCRYLHAFTTAPVCSASRSAFMTGRYQTSFGAQNHRSHRNDGYHRPQEIRLITERLREAGYFTANVRALPPELGFKGTGKTDWNFFDDHKAFDSDQWGDLKAHQPFYAQVNFHETHRPYFKAKQNPTDPAKVKLPPYLADDPVIRADWAAYLDEVAELDTKVGKVLELLERQGLKENTIVFLFADHGREDFRGKYYAYEQGFNIPLIIRWPALLKPGSTNDGLISMLDVHAQCLAMAGVKAEGLDGAPFFGPEAKPREFVFCARDRIDDTPDRIRTVRDVRYKYIRNLEPERAYLQPMAYAEVTNPSYVRMRQLSAEGKLNPAQSKFMAPHRPSEELYDLESDPFELRNLAEDAQQRSILERLRAKLDIWMKETHDQGGIPEDPAEVQKEMDQLAKSVAKMKAQRGAEGGN